MTIEILTKFKKVVQRERSQSIKNYVFFSQTNIEFNRNTNNFVYKNFGIMHRGLANGCPLKNKKKSSTCRVYLAKKRANFGKNGPISLTKGVSERDFQF